MISGVITADAAGRGWAILVPCAAIAAFLLAGSIWHTMLRGGHVPSLRRGALAGCAVGILAHPIAWILAFASSYVLRIDEGTAVGDYANALPTFAVVGWIFFGWITALAGAAIGLLVTLMQRGRART